MRRIAEPRLIVGFVLIFGVLCANAFVLASNMRTVTRNREGVERSHEVTEALDSVFSTVQDAETGQRGFLLTGNMHYLEPYNLARESIDKRLAQLQDLARDSPAQQLRIANLKPAIEAKLFELNETIQLRRNVGESAALREVLSDRGEGYMDSIRGNVIQMKTAEDRLLARRKEESRASEQKTRATFAGATILSLILLVIVYIVIVRSVEDRQRSADALQKREEWLSTTLRSIGDAVIATDARGAVLFMNAVAEQLTGWTQESATGEDANAVFAIINETTRAAVKSPVSQVVEENRIVELANHTLLVARDGTETSIDDSAAPIHDSAGTMIGVVLVFRDISERKTAQKQREIYLVELEALNRRLQRAITETNHRVKNNLQLISAMVELHALEGDGTLSAKEVKRLGTNISTLATVQDVLTKASKREGDASDVSTKEILEKLLQIHQHTAPRHKITAQLEDVRLPGTQSTALALLANELLSNSIKHGKSEVHLTIHADTTLNTLEMHVADDGPGFADAFDPMEAANTGLELVVSLAKWDLRGELRFGNHGKGGDVSLCMPLPTPAKQ